MTNAMRAWPARVALTCAVVLFSGCSFGVETAGTIPEAHGCGDDVASGFYSATLNRGGRERSFNVYIPEGYDGQSRQPLLIAMHGGFGTGAIFEEQARFAPVADRYGYIVAYPNGVWRAFNAGTCCGEPAEDNIDDVGFVAEVVEKVSSRYCVDKDRVYATGFSNGAMMAHRIACERPDLFTAFASVAGTIMVESCPAEEPTPALLIRGRADEHIPWEGGMVNETYRRSMEEVVSIIAERNQCSSKAKVTFKNGDAVCKTLQGCAARLTYCGIANTGHQWPGGKTVLGFMLGPNTKDYDATGQIFRFFEQVGAGP